MYSGFGEGAQILKRIELEGNEVGLYIDDKIYKNVFNGLLRKVDNPDDFIDKDTIIIFDMSGFGNIADNYRNSNHLVFGASKFCDNLEHDRNFGFDVMKTAGIKIPDYKEFKSFSDGINYVMESGKKLVFKPNGSMPCKLTYCAEDAAQMEVYLKFIEKKFKKHIDSFILQDFIEGVIVSSEFFCSNGELVWPPNHTVEVKKVMNGDLGPSTGCSGNITWPALTKIIEEGIYKAKDFIKKQNYTGQIDLNSVVNEDGVFGLEWTPRFGYDATPTYLALLKEDTGKVFSDLCRGDMQVMPINDIYAGSVRLTIPPYPLEPDEPIDTEKVTANEGIPIQNWEDYQGSLYFYEVMCEDGNLVHSGGTGVICLAISCDKDCAETISNAECILKEIKVPDKQYRTDLCDVLEKMIEEVQQYA